MGAERTFTLREAEALLPVLQDLLQTAMQAHQRVEEAEEELQAHISRILLAGGVQSDPIRTSRLRAERDRSTQQLEDAVREIAASGAQVKDLDLGLLDFPCLWKGNLVLLCWKLGEQGIHHWHGLQEGFANRKPLDSSMDSESGGGRVH